MATRPTRTTRSRQPSAQPPELPKPRAKLTRSGSSAERPEAPMKPPSNARKPVARTNPETGARTVSQSSTSTIHEEQPNPPAKVASSSKTSDSDGEREPIKAYLRIRPNLGDADAAAPTPYLDRLSDTTVRMTDPGTEDASRTRMRQSIGVADANYTFTHVFPAETAQPTFFASTTLPLVRDLLLNGQNGLLFAYGVTNSGKTYTIQGGSETGSAGILPRTFDVLFNSIGDLQGNGQFRPIRLQGVAPNDGTVEPDVSLDDLRAAEPALANVLEEFADDGSGDIDPTVFKLDRNHEYSVWLSYAEIYNDKVYDLLVPMTPSKMQRGPHSAAEVVRKALTLKNSPPSDAWDSEFSSGKYADGLQHIRVRSAAEARTVLKLGQLHRRVVGTFANKESSRSHAVVSIKLLRVHRGERSNLSAVQTSRLTLVDLAGSERTKYTQTTGDRLKEAGYINRSLMVLGQCLETLRANQRKIGNSLTGGGRSDTRDTKKGLQVVPFRHNKMTELLMDYFVGDGRVIMIVNVNPFDTGFDENAHVMRFASLAREVSTTVARPPSPSKLPTWQASQTKLKPPAKRPSGSRRSVTVSLGSNAPMVLDILEEDEEATEVEDESDCGPHDAFIRELFDENDGLRAQLYEAHMRTAVVEAETREEVMNEMEGRMRQMEAMFQARLEDAALAYEEKLARKMELFGDPGLGFGQAGPSRYADDVDMDGYDTEEAEEFDIEKSLTQDALLAHSPEPPTPLLSGGALPPITPEPEQDNEPSTPIASGSMTQLPPPEPEDDNPIPVDLPDLDLGVDLDSPTNHLDDHADKEDMATRVYDSSDEEADYKPPPPKKPRHSKPAAPVTSAAPAPLAALEKGSAKAPIVIDLDDDQPVVLTKSHVKGKGISLADMDDLDDVPDADPDRSGIAVIPNRKARAAAIAHGGPGVTYIPMKGEVDTIKKKKRVLAKKPVVTEDQIDRLVYRQEQEQGGRPVRRITRRS